MHDRLRRDFIDFDFEMEMIRHFAMRKHLEWEFRFHFGDHLKEDTMVLRVAEDVHPSDTAGDEMVQGTWIVDSWRSHTIYT